MNNLLFDKATKDPRLTRGALLLLYYLIKIDFPWTKSQTELANSANMERSVVCEAIARLESCGYLKRITIGKMGFITRKKIILKNG